MPIKHLQKFSYIVDGWNVLKIISSRKFIITWPVFISQASAEHSHRRALQPQAGKLNPSCQHVSAIQSHPVPLVISLFSVRPPQREMAMEGKSRTPSEVLSAPLSTPELPTDCGEWLAGRGPTSAVLLLWALSPLEKKNQEFGLHVLIPRFPPFNKHC